MRFPLFNYICLLYNVICYLSTGMFSTCWQKYKTYLESISSLSKKTIFMWAQLYQLRMSSLKWNSLSICIGSLYYHSMVAPLKSSPPWQRYWLPRNLALHHHWDSSSVMTEILTSYEPSMVAPLRLPVRQDRYIEVLWT